VSVADLDGEVSYMTSVTSEYLAFYMSSPNASVVLHAIFDVLPPDSVIASLSVSDNSVVLSGRTVSLGAVSDYIEALRAGSGGLFSVVNAQTVVSAPDEVEFTMTLGMISASDPAGSGELEELGGGN